MNRFLDIFAALIFLIVLSPVIVLAVILVVIFDRQNPIFKQERIGQDKNPFTIFKLRTMKSERITILGRVLRKTGIDEFPQFLNVLKGDMSFIGPRPLTFADIQRLNWETDYYKKRWSIRPGIIGLAQLSPICHKKMSWHLDKMYIEKKCLLLDARILLSSALVPILGKSKVKSIIHKR